MNVAVGIDVGGTSVRAALVEPSGALVRADRHLLTAHTPEAVLEQVLALVQRLDAGALSLPAALGFAGQLYPATGVVAVAPNFGWHDVPLGEMLAEAFGHPVRLVNDLDAITMGEARRGAGQGSRDVLCVFVGTGVGMGAVCQGLLVEGADGLATELGHTKVASPESGRPCGCGERGCLEAYTSGRHLPELLAEKAGATGRHSPLLERAAGDLAQLHAASIETAAHAGDPVALALWDDIGERLGMATANMVTVMNPRVLVFGGGVLLLAPSLKQRVVAMVRRAAARPALSHLEIRDTELGDDAGLVGAGIIAHETTRAPSARG